MSINRTDYIVYGWKLPFDIKSPFDFSFRSKEYVLIIDHLWNDYVVFGLKIDYCEDYWKFVELDFKNLDTEKVKSKFKHVFDFEPTTEPYLFIFSHYS